MKPQFAVLCRFQREERKKFECISKQKFASNKNSSIIGYVGKKWLIPEHKFV